MGFRWSTPRVFGVSYSTRIGPRPDSAAAAVFGGLLIGVLVLGLALRFWYVTVPLVVLVGGLVIYGKHVQRIEAAPRTPPRRSQASVSNRR